MYLLDRERDVLCFVEFWSRDLAEVHHFRHVTRKCLFKAGVGLPGRAWSTRQLVWIADIADDANFPRRSAAARNGLRSGFAFPILVEGEVVGVVEFVSSDRREPCKEFIEMLTGLSGQLGQFVERKRAEESLRESERRFRQLADAMPQIVWASPSDGCLDYFNQKGKDLLCQVQDDPANNAWINVVHPDDQERTTQAWSEAVRTGNPFEIEY